MVAVPINLGWRPDEVSYVLDHSRARGLAIETQLVKPLQDAIGKVAGVAEVIVMPGLAATYEQEPSDRHWTTTEALAESGGNDAEPQCVVDDRDAISYLYTSGTTSFPKGVVGAHLSIYLESMSAALDSGWNAGDRFAAMMPMFHTAQLNAFCTPAILVGATTYVLRAFDPPAWLDLIEREKITQVFGLPMMFRAALDDPSFDGRDLTSLRRAVYAMAPMPDELIRRCLAAYRCDFALLFGQTEMCPAPRCSGPSTSCPTSVRSARRSPASRSPSWARTASCCRRASWARSSTGARSTMQGYLDNPDATGAAFAHGWFHSGDVGRLGDDGVLWFADRLQGRDQDRRRERGLDRGGEGRVRGRARGGRGRGRRPAPRALDRGHHRGRGAPAGRDDRPGRAARPGPRAPGRVQDAQGGYRRR